MMVALLTIILLDIIFTLDNELSEFIEISINEEDFEYDIDPKKKYKFNIENNNYLYTIPSDLKTYIYVDNENNKLKSTTGKNYFEKGDSFYVNYLLNLNKNIKFKTSSLVLYDTLNEVGPISSNKEFSIKSSEESIAYFDSFDRNSKVFISKNDNNHYNEKITGKFYKIQPNIIYFIKNEIYDISFFKQYFYPLNLNIKRIEMDSQSFLYLKVGHTYNLNFKQKKMIKLSEKTLNSKVYISLNGEEKAILSKDSPYYELNDDYKAILTLIIKDNDAFLEFYSLNNEKKKVFNEIAIDNYQIDIKNIVIKIKKTQKRFKVHLKSNDYFSFSISLGLTKSENYYLYSKYDLGNSNINNEITLEYPALYKDLVTLENEFIYFLIRINDTERPQQLYISYNISSEIDDILEEFDKFSCQMVISNIIGLLDTYIYNDISKNPPEIPGYPNYHHRIDLKEELNKISTDNRKLYEFYQDIKKILASPKDLHIIFSQNEIGSYSAFLPFKFVIKKYNGEQRVFIAKNEYFNLFDENIQKSVNSNLNIPLKKINDIDPFDYIQNFNKFSLTKNPHAQFTYNMRIIHSFNLEIIPSSLFDISLNEYEFENNEIIRLSYKIEKQSFITNLEKEKPKIGSIYWDLKKEENDEFIKCRVDKYKNVNVLIQNTFKIGENINELISLAFGCSKLFHSNNYPIIIIETNNDGGKPELAMLMIQLLQLRQVEKMYVSYKKSELSEKIHKMQDEGTIAGTCDKTTSFSNLFEISDHYNYNNLNIEHKRTQPLVYHLKQSEIKALNNLRKEYKDSPNLKKPTDIIIFTDSYSLSSASTFIKGFQDLGGAIIVGYFGNPKIEGIDLFDASQSNSEIQPIPDEDKSDLLYLGFDIYLTTGEVFDDSFAKENPIPMEYTINPVDYRVDIYSEYNDNIYDDFIDEGIKIFSKFNVQNYCNSKNKKLILHVNNCNSITDDEHAHGGYICGDNNIWDKTKCIPYYCDIGFYFDKNQKKCIEECKYENQIYYLYDKDEEHSKMFSIDKNETYEFITSNPDNYYYSFISDEDAIFDYPRVCFINRGHHIYINKFLKFRNTFLTIQAVKSDINYIEHFKDNIFIEEFSYLGNKKLYVIDTQKNDVFFFLYNLDDFSKGEIRYVNYFPALEPKDILNSDYGEFYNHFGGILKLLKRDEIYFIHLNVKSLIYSFLMIKPLMSLDNIRLMDYPNFIYLKKDKVYYLDELKTLSSINIDVMIKLSKNTPNSELRINEEYLNSNKYYYELNELLSIEEEDELLSFFELEVYKEDAFIEILYKHKNEEEIDILDFNKLSFNLQKLYNLIIIPKIYVTNTIRFTLNAEKNPRYIIYKGISILNYYHYPKEKYFNYINNNTIVFDVVAPYKYNTKFMENEYYSIFIIKTQGDLNLNIKILN